MKDKENSPVFNFDKADITRHIQYELKVMRRMNKAFDYVYGKLLEQGFYADTNNKPYDLDLSKIESSEGKNYNWLAITASEHIQILIRTYGNHHTIYTKLTTTRTYGKGEKATEYNEYRYSAFTFNTETRNAPIDKQDFLNENNFWDLDNAMPQILEHIAKERVRSLWNSVGFIRPDYVNVCNVYDNESIASIDKLIFCAEELSSKQVEIYAETDVLEMLKSLPDTVIGTSFNSIDVISNVRTEFPKQYLDPYYHGVGIEVIERQNKTKFIDVYSLCYYYLQDFLNLMENNK